MKATHDGRSMTIAPVQGSVDQYAAFVRNELAKWTKMVAAAGLKVE